MKSIEKLPKGTNILVRGGAAASDDAWNPTIRVFQSHNGLIAVVEMDEFERNHFNYPEGYNGASEVTCRYFPDRSKYYLTFEEVALLQDDKRFEATKSYMARTNCDQYQAKHVIDKWKWEHNG